MQYHVVCITWERRILQKNWIAENADEYGTFPKGGRDEGKRIHGVSWPMSNGKGNLPNKACGQSAGKGARLWLTLALGVIVADKREG